MSTADRDILIHARHLDVARYFIAKNDVRYYLQGVLVEPAKTGGAVAVGTNGHILGAMRDDQGHSNGRHIVRITPELKRHIGPRSGPNSWIRFSRDTAAVVAQAVGLGEAREATPSVTFESLPIEFEYPDWQKVISVDRTPGARRPSIAPKYLEIAAKAAMRATSDLNPSALMSMDETGPNILRLHETHEFIAVLMPMRMDAKERAELSEVPKWAQCRKKRKSRAKGVAA